MVYLITMRTLLWVKSMYGKGQNPRKWIGHIIVYAVGLQWCRRWYSREWLILPRLSDNWDEWVTGSVAKASLSTRI
jgi:hypothetical protein